MGPALSGDVRVAPDGTVHVCYYQSTAKVQRWDGAVWVPVGGPASCGQSWQNFLFFDGDSNVLVASRDYDSPGNLNVHRRIAGAPWEVLNMDGVCPSYSGTFFQNVHNPVGISLGGGVGFLRGPDNLVLLVLDGPSSDQRPTALTRRGGTWELLGSQRFSQARASSVSLGHSGGEFWAAYWEDYQGGQLCLSRYDRAAQDWQLEATEALRGDYTTLAEGHGQQFVITNDLDTPGRALRSYSRRGADLVRVGGVIAAGVDMGQQGWIQQVSAAQDSKQRLYVAYSYDDPSTGLDSRIGISRLTRSSAGFLVWKVYTLADPGVHDVSFVTMDLDPATDTIYVGHTQASPQDGMDLYSIQITD